MIKITVLTASALLLISARFNVLTTQHDRVVAQEVKIEHGKKTTPKRAAPTSTPRKSIESRTSRHDAPEIEMVYVHGGSFLMGSLENETGRDSDEGPQHRVTVGSFYIGKYEVTQAQWRVVMGGNPSIFKGDNLPVDEVSWNEAKDFCRRLSQMTGEKYRLPTEAEWEYACRAKTDGVYAGDLDAMAWYGKISDSNIFGLITTRGPQPVGQKQPNAFGLYDMHGNVMEWCEDDWHDSYVNAPSDGSAWTDKPRRGSKRMFRGGSWNTSAAASRSAYRNSDFSWGRDPGFRLARTYR